MFMALFAWISSSTLAYVYGKEESFYEEYMSVNGREYPRKIFLQDGRSSEIKQTLAGCLARALPTLVTELRLPVPVSILEQGLVCFECRTGFCFINFVFGECGCYWNSKIEKCVEKIKILA